MNTRRILFGIFSALITFSVSVALISFWFLPKSSEKKEVLVAATEKSTFELGANQLPQPYPFKEQAFPDIRDERITVAGKLEIIETEPLEWKITLDGKQILSDEYLPPNIDGHIKSKVSPFDEVVVLTQSSGTCCEFERFWFLGLKSNGSYYLSKAIGDGFATVPVISASKDYVKVKVRGGRENHGEGYLAGGEWILQNGRVRKRR